MNFPSSGRRQPGISRRVVLSICLLGAIVAGCGDDDGGPADAPGAAGSPYAPSPSAPDHPGNDGTTAPPPATPVVIEEKTLTGTFEFGQTHIVGRNETRLAPNLVEGRSTLLLFTPASAIPEQQNVFVEAVLQGVSLGRYYMRQPTASPFFVEDRLSVYRLPAYGARAWSAQLPANWTRPGVTFTVGYDEPQVPAHLVHAWRASTDLPALAPVAPFTVARTKVVLWGEADHSTETLPLRKLATDFYAVLPVAGLRTVDYTPARWDYFIFKPKDGGAPRRANSHAEYVAAGGGAFYNAMRTTAILASKANTGRGLQVNVFGDNSPFSFGTYVGQGLYRSTDGSYGDMDDIGAAGGWTGWSAIWWNSDCSNAFIHEVGHSFTLAHFDKGTAQGWGIADEYPYDGIWLATHPHPYDTVRGAFRTWYKVGSGFAYPATEQELVGKRDPMNGGESSDAQSCFPPYTAYHARKIQQWMRNSPTILNRDGVPGFYKWDDATRQFAPYKTGSDTLLPARVNVPVATLAGTLAAASAPDARQIYPAMYAASGNTFVMPDPFKPGLPAQYTGAKYFVDVRYESGRHAYTLIPQREITDASLLNFSINVALDERPVEAVLMEAAQPYPMIPATGNTVLSRRTIDAATAVPEVMEFGPGFVRQDREVSLSSVCTASSCSRQSMDVAWYPDDGVSLHFVAQDAAVGPIGATSDANGPATRLTVPMQGADGVTRNVVMRASRTVNTPDGYFAMPASYAGAATKAQSGNLQRLVLWIHRDDNPDLPSGTYTTERGIKLSVVAGDGAHAKVVDEVTVRATFTTPTMLTLGVDKPYYRGYTLPGSSIYFTTLDARQGPTSGKWAFSGEETRLQSLVRDTSTGEAVNAHFRAVKRNCGPKGDHFSMNDGAYYVLNCEYGVELRFKPADNPGLVSGRRYVTDPDQELMIAARGWHINRQLDLLAIRWDFVMP